MFELTEYVSMLPAIRICVMRLDCAAEVPLLEEAVRGLFEVLELKADWTGW